MVNVFPLLYKSNWKEFTRKLKIKLNSLLFNFLFPLPFALLVVPALILIKPLLRVRLGKIRVERMGHMILDVELFLCEKEAQGERNKKTCEIFYYTDSVCNKHLLKLWKRTIFIAPAFSKVLDCAARILIKIPSGRDHLIQYWPKHSDEYGLISQWAPHIKFSDKEESLGVMQLKGMGVTGDFITFHARDSAYLEKSFPGINWEEHDYRDANIENYLEAVIKLSQRNLSSFRMGSIVKSPLVSNNPKVLDYATHFRSDFMDIYLFSHCKFSINSSSGIYGIPKIFKRPMVAVNLIPLHSYIYFGGNDIFLPKLLKSTKEDRLLTFQECIDLLGRDISRLVKEKKIIVLENSAEDIANIVLEMDDRLNGTWEETNEDKELQHSFWEIVEMSTFKKPSQIRIGADFLRQHQNLLS